MNSKEYWNNKIIEWEDSLHDSGKVSLIESLAARFREPLKVRRQLCFKLLKKIGKGKTILELGCGSGYFAIKTFREIRPKKMIGLDISRNAIQRANTLKKKLRISGKKLEFIEADTTALQTLPEADITVGLGFLDYLSAPEIRTLMRNLKSTYIIFTFSERKVSLARYLHILYLISQNCPKHYYYTKEEIVSIVKERYKNVTIVSGKKLMFGCIVHNIP